MAANAKVVERAYAAFGRGDIPAVLALLGEIGDVVVGVVRVDGKRRGGKPAGYGAAHVFRVRDGKIASYREYVDADAAID